MKPRKSLESAVKRISKRRGEIIIPKESTSIVPIWMQKKMRAFAIKNQSNKRVNMERPPKLKKNYNRKR